MVINVHKDEVGKMIEYYLNDFVLKPEIEVVGVTFASTMECFAVEIAEPKEEQ